MEYYSTTKKNLKFEGKWVGIAQTQKTNISLLCVNISLESLDMCFIWNILKG